jgi:hypothetical protein
VHTAVSQFVCNFGGEVVVVATVASRLRFGLDYLLVMVWSPISSCLVRYPWRKVNYPLFFYLA